MTGRVGLCVVTLACAFSFLGGCDESGLSSSELQRAAETRVSRELGLSADAALFTDTFVSEPEAGVLKGELVLCGIVEGKRADGTEIAPRRFIAGMDPARWVRFDVSGQMTDKPINMAADWSTICAGEQEVR